MWHELEGEESLYKAGFRIRRRIVSVSLAREIIRWNSVAQACPAYDNLTYIYAQAKKWRSIAHFESIFNNNSYSSLKCITLSSALRWRNAHDKTQFRHSCGVENLNYRNHYYWSPEIDAFHRNLLKAFWLTVWIYESSSKNDNFIWARATNVSKMRIYEETNAQRISINIIPAVAIPIFHFIDAHTRSTNT